MIVAACVLGLVLGGVVALVLLASAGPFGGLGLFLVAVLVLAAITGGDRR